MKWIFTSILIIKKHKYEVSIEMISRGEEHLIIAGIGVSGGVNLV
jgi:hypothetical protein